MSDVGTGISVFIGIGRVFVVVVFSRLLVFSELLVLVDLVSKLLSEDLWLLSSTISRFPLLRQPIQWLYRAAI